jgi:hypothetical protein
MFKLFHYLALIFQAISVIIIPVNGDWPSGKATGSGPVIGVRIASGNLQGNLPLQAKLARAKFRARGTWVESDSNPQLVRYNINLLVGISQVVRQWVLVP